MRLDNVARPLTLPRFSPSGALRAPEAEKGGLHALAAVLRSDGRVLSLPLPLPTEAAVAVDRYRSAAEDAVGLVVGTVPRQVVVVLDGRVVRVDEDDLVPLLAAVLTDPVAVEHAQVRVLACGAFLGDALDVLPATDARDALALRAAAGLVAALSRPTLTDGNASDDDALFGFVAEHGPCRGASDGRCGRQRLRRASPVFAATAVLPSFRRRGSSRRLECRNMRFVPYVFTTGVAWFKSRAARLTSRSAHAGARLVPVVQRLPRCLPLGVSDVRTRLVDETGHAGRLTGNPLWYSSMRVASTSSKSARQSSASALIGGFQDSEKVPISGRGRRYEGIDE